MREVAETGQRVTAAHLDGRSQAATEGLTNTRTRVVGARTGVLAETIVWIVRVSRALGRVLLRVAERVSAVITALGWAVMFLAPIALASGYALGLTELVVVGWAGLVLILFAAVHAIGRNSFEMELELAHTRVVVGQSATGSVLVANPVRHRILGAAVEVPVGEGMFEFLLPSLGRGESFEHAFAVPTTRRGVIPVGPVRTVRADPIGLIRRELVWAAEEELFVHPRTIGIPSTTTGFIRDLEGSTTRRLSDSDVSFHALREYVPGDDRRYIHWKSSARTGRHMVRQFEETRRSHLAVVLSLAESDYANDEEFELAVSVAGSLGTRAIRDTRTLSVVVSERTPDWARRKLFAMRRLSTLTRTRLLDDLTRVERASSALSLRDTARVAAESVAGISVAFLVCGSGTSIGDLRAASASFPVDVAVIAIVCDPEVVPGLRRVPGLGVLSIGYLEDLKRSLARSAAA